MLYPPSMKQQVCFCPKEMEASSLSRKRNVTRWFNTHNTIYTFLNLTQIPSGWLRAACTGLCYVAQCSDSLRMQRATRLVSPVLTVPHYTVSPNSI